MKTNNELWASLKLEEKEKIASLVKGSSLHYPECTDFWNGLGRKRQDEVRQRFQNAADASARPNSLPFGD